MMWSLIKYKIANYPNDQIPQNLEALKEAIQREWKAIDIATVNRLVRSFKLRLQLCSRLGGKSIAPYLKNHQYKNPQQYPLEEPPYIFDLMTDLKLLEYKKQSWKKVGQKMSMNSNLVKYRTNSLQL